LSSTSECAGCLEHFVSVKAFDAHRRDATKIELAADSWLRRRCRTADEMSAAGWEKTSKGWRHPLAMRTVAKMASARGPQAA
jgi:hypothetical protein